MTTQTLPPFNLNALITLVVGGLVAMLAFDFFGQVLSPMLRGVAGPYIGATLAPVALANQSLGVVTGLGAKVIATYKIGFIAHLLTGLLFYPVGYMYIARPISRIAPFVPWWIVGIAYGVVIWVFAMYVMAHLVAGNPPFLNWSGITWVALWGHILFAVVFAAFVWWRHERTSYRNSSSRASV